MVTLSILLALLGFELFYQTSKKAILSRPPKLENWFLSNEKPAKLSGTMLFVISLNISIFHFGIGSGIFAFLVVLMLVGSLVVLVSPIWKGAVYWLFPGFVILFLIELL